MIASTIHREENFERYVSRKLRELDGEGWQVSPNDDGFDPDTALVIDDLVSFLEVAWAEKLDKLRREKGSKWRDVLQAALVRSLRKSGTIATLRGGFPLPGYATVPCMAGYPDDPRVPGAMAAYEANVCRAMHQVHYQTAGNNSLDMAFFINGVAVATAEVKTELTQTYEDAIAEYREERLPVEPDGRKNPLLMYGRGAVVHFAFSEDEVWMCTDLGPECPRFLPFNLGRDGGKGNPEPPEGEYPTHYLWDDVLRRDNWLSVFDRFVFEERSRRQDATGRYRDVSAQIFPRYHQFRCVRRVLADVRANGAGTRYLIEHSPGSGKTETISWCAHDLARLRRGDGEKLFSSVVVVTDRLSLDENIKATIGQLSRTKGQVVMVGRDEDGRAGAGSKTAQLVKALREHREIVVVTVQTFLYAWPEVAQLAELDGRAFAVIVDEAHSSQDGESSASLKAALNAAADKARFRALTDAAEDADVTDEDAVNEFFRQAQAAGAMPGNVTFLAFTATPKPETYTLFGTPTGREDAEGREIMGSFDLYPMRQAIEEGYIIDPLSGYLPLRAVSDIIDTSDSGKVVDEKAAKRRIAKWRSLHPTNVMEKAKWIVDHFVANAAGRLGGEAKAMIVTSGRPEVVRYKYAIEAYIRSRPDYAPIVDGKINIKAPGDPLVAFSEKVSGAKCVMDEDEYLKDNPFAAIRRDYEYTESNMNPVGRGDVTRQFDQPDAHLLIVANKFQTGFDQKKLVALYVDKQLSNAVEIVQTYSRVNRTYPGKDQVFVVDFANDPKHVLAAFKVYDKGARMERAQDPFAVYDVRGRLDEAGIYFDEELEGFKEALYASKAQAADGSSDAYRQALYACVAAPARRFNDAMRAASEAYAVWEQMASDYAAAGDDAELAECREKEKEVKGQLERLAGFRSDLGRFCSLYELCTQMMVYDDPELEVFHSFAKLLGKRMAGTPADDIDMRGLVMDNYSYRIVGRDKPDGVRGGDLAPTGGGAGGGKAPARETRRKIVQELNLIWGSGGDAANKAAIVNLLVDAVLADPVTRTRITNESNSKESVLDEGRLKSLIAQRLLDMITGDYVNLAEQAIKDPQSLPELESLVFDLVRSGERIDVAEVAEAAAEVMAEEGK